MPGPTRTRRASGKRAAARMSVIDTIVDECGDNYLAAARRIADRAKAVRQAGDTMQVTWRNGVQAASVKLRPHTAMWRAVLAFGVHDTALIMDTSGTGWSRVPVAKRTESEADRFCDRWCPDGLTVLDCFRMRRDDVPLSAADRRHWHAVYDRVPADVGTQSQVCGREQSRKPGHRAPEPPAESRALVRGWCPPSVDINHCVRAYEHWVPDPTPEMAEVLRQLRQVEIAME